MPRIYLVRYTRLLRIQCRINVTTVDADSRMLTQKCITRILARNITSNEILLLATVRLDLHSKFHLKSHKDIEYSVLLKIEMHTVWFQHGRLHTRPLVTDHSCILTIVIERYLAWLLLVQQKRLINSAAEGQLNVKLYQNGSNPIPIHTTHQITVFVSNS